MQNQFIFEEKKEIERLRVQNELLSTYEAPVFHALFSERPNCTILDIGCNDGKKTVERFSSDAIRKVIGVEYNAALVQKAVQNYGDERFSFYPLDVESSDFSARLSEIMKENDVQGFDVIYLSFVLMHLSKVKELLISLRPFLKPDGKLFIIEADDGSFSLSNDENGLLEDFLNILKKDKYSGNREAGANICSDLSACGYENTCVWFDAISAGDGEKKKKKAIFTTFFTYLPEDVQLLLSAEPENEEYKSWAAWIDLNYKTLRHLIMQKESRISMGMKILTCTKGKE